MLLRMQLVSLGKVYLILQEKQSIQRTLKS